MLVCGVLSSPYIQYLYLVYIVYKLCTACKSVEFVKSELQYLNSCFKTIIIQFSLSITANYT